MWPGTAREQLPFSPWEKTTSELKVGVCGRVERTRTRRHRSPSSRPSFPCFLAAFLLAVISECCEFDYYGFGGGQ